MNCKATRILPDHLDTHSENKREKMVAEKKFCTNCGNPLDIGAKFCAYCGQPLTQLYPNAAPASQIEATTPSTPNTTRPAVSANTNVPAANVDYTPSAEQIVGVIPGISRKKGMFNIESYHIVVTPKRLIFAAVTNEIMKEEAQKSSGKGIGSYLKTALAGNDFTQRYLNMAPEQALHEDPQNFDVDISRVRKVKVEKGTLYLDGRKQDDGKLIIETAGDKLSFMLKNNYYDVARHLFQKVGLA